MSKVMMVDQGNNGGEKTNKYGDVGNDCWGGQTGTVYVAGSGAPTPTATGTFSVLFFLNNV